MVSKRRYAGVAALAAERVVQVEVGTFHHVMISSFCCKKHQMMTASMVSQYSPCNYSDTRE
jgi:hypothetical protein